MRPLKELQQRRPLADHFEQTAPRRVVLQVRLQMLGQVRETFWQADYFDRYIRDQEHYRKVVRYIENNPVKARLCTRPADYRFSSAWFREHRAESTQLLTGIAGALTRK